MVHILDSNASRELKVLSLLFHTMCRSMLRRLYACTVLTVRFCTGEVALLRCVVSYLYCSLMFCGDT